MEKGGIIVAQGEKQTEPRGTARKKDGDRDSPTGRTMPGNKCVAALASGLTQANPKRECRPPFPVVSADESMTSGRGVVPPRPAAHAYSVRSSVQEAPGHRYPARKKIETGRVWWKTSRKRASITEAVQNDAPSASSQMHSDAQKIKMDSGLNSNKHGPLLSKVTTEILMVRSEAPGSSPRGWSEKFAKSGLKKPLVSGRRSWKSHFLDKIWPRKATFQDKDGKFLASKSHFLDKEIANFRPRKATFSDHPLGELPGASGRLKETGSAILRT
ncbi:hypothetical protein B0H19DRAFT_1341304 [Mycena capillaripes]|nr:hypothetical protein B0H19DRAFT_1341304 [Mycena capillaripes]